jgi:acyl dehydratase
VSKEHAKITDEMLDNMRATIGIRKPGVRNAWSTEATLDSFKRYAWGIGDPNPLWTDQAYAATTALGRVVAPPSWLYSCQIGPLGPGSAPSRGAGLPGIHGLYIGDSWELHSHVELGDKIISERYLDSVDELESNYAGRMIRVINATQFFRQDGSSLGISRSEIRKHERGTPKKGESGKKAKYADIEAWVYSDEELHQIAQQYESEQPRGGAPIDWASVVVGEEIPARLKGPLTVTGIITYLMGWGSPFCMTDRIAHEYIRLHPKANVPDSKSRSPDFPERAHWDEALWREIGFPLGYDIGPGRVSWFSHLLTDWIGDAGRIEEYKIDLREPNWLGDITWCRGRVTEKSIVDGQPKVKLELWGESQRGRVHARGHASVVLGNVVNI